MRGELLSDAEGPLLDKIDILRNEVKALKAQVVPMVSNLIKRMKVFEESRADTAAASAQTVAAQGKRIEEINGLRTHVNSLRETKLG